MLVDGYNIIFAWDELKELAKDNLNMARDRLIDILCNYQGFKQCNLILVFDAYKVKGNVGSAEKIHNINVVYTKEAETADMYIEKITHEIGKKHRVRVATSDNLEQIIILGNGATRLSANELLQEVKLAEKTIMDIVLRRWISWYNNGKRFKEHKRSERGLAMNKGRKNPRNRSLSERKDAY